DGKVVQRLLGIALILDGRGRSEAASLVGLDPQTLARAVQHYNADGIAGLKDRTSPGRPPKLTDEQSAELKRMILAGPEDRDNGCPEYKVRHIVDLVKDKWGICISPETVRTRLHAMNLVPLVCRPRHHEADPVAQAAFKEKFPEVLAKINPLINQSARYAYTVRRVRREELAAALHSAPIMPRMLRRWLVVQ